MELISQKNSEKKWLCQIQLTSNEWESYQNQALKSLGANLQLAGFRPHKIPVAILKTKIKPIAYEQKALDLAAYNVCKYVLGCVEFLAALPYLWHHLPQVSFVTWKQNLPVFECCFTTIPKIKPLDFTSWKILKLKPTVNKKDITAQIQSYLRKYGMLVLKKEQVVGINDVVLLDCQVFDKHNQLVLHLCKTDWELDLSSAQAPKQLVDALVLSKVGTEKKLTIGSYLYQVKIKNIYQMELPVYDDAFVASLNQKNIKTKQEFEKQIASDLQQKTKQELWNQIQTHLWQASQAANIVVPQQLVDNHLKTTFQNIDLEKIKQENPTLLAELQTQAADSFVKRLSVNTVLVQMGLTAQLVIKEEEIKSHWAGFIKQFHQHKFNKAYLTALLKNELLSQKMGQKIAKYFGLA